MKFDLAIDFKTDPRNRIIMWLCGIKNRFGFDCGVFRSLLNGRVKYGQQHESVSDLNLVNAIIGRQEPVLYKFSVPEKDKIKTELFLKQEGVFGKDKIVVIHAVARWPAKMWPMEKSAALSDKLLSLPGVKVVFVGAGEDLRQIDKIKRMAKIAPIVSAGKLNFLQTSALIQKAFLFIGNDAAPMHMAALFGVPTVALFGPTDPDLTRPLSNNSIVVRKIAARCRGCFRRNAGSCLYPSRFCMDKISVDDVFGICMKYLARGQL